MQMRRTLLAAVCGAALTAALVTIPAVALAQDDTGPGTQACTDAGLTVIDVQLDVDAAQKALADGGFQAQLDTFTTGAPGTPSLADLETDVQASVDADNAAGLAADSQATLDAKTALDARVSLIAGVRADLDATLDAVTDAETDLAAAVTARDIACTVPDEPAAPAPSGGTGGEDDDLDVSDLLPDANDDEDFDQLGADRVPSGGIETGA